MSKNITAAAIAIARNRNFLATEPNGSAKGRPGTFIEALACLPSEVKAIGYMPVHGLNPLHALDGTSPVHNSPLGPSMFSLEAINKVAPEWEAKFRRMRGNQWRVVTVDGQTFIINVHSRRPVEFRSVTYGDERYPMLYGPFAEWEGEWKEWGNKDDSAPASTPRKPGPVTLSGPAAAALGISVAGLTTPDEQALLRKAQGEFWDGNDMTKGPDDNAITIKEATVVVQLTDDDFLRLRGAWTEEIGWDQDGNIVTPIASFGDVAAQMLKSALEDRARPYDETIAYCADEIEHAIGHQTIFSPDASTVVRLLKLRNKLNEYFGKPRPHGRPGTLRLVPPAAEKNIPA